jgi:hypothetical protein
VRIAYKVMCPNCTVEGKNNRVFYDDGAFFCDNNHTFSSMSEIEDRIATLPDSLKVQEAPAKEKPKVQPKVIPVPEDRPEEEVFEEALKSMSMAPPPTAHTSAEVERSNLPVSATAVEEIPEPKKIIEVMPEKRYVGRQPKELPGDALEITVVIPDPHASFLRGEAQAQGKAVQEYFEERLMFGMDSRWYY